MDDASDSGGEEPPANDPLKDFYALFSTAAAASAAASTVSIPEISMAIEVGGPGLGTV